MKKFIYILVFLITVGFTVESLVTKKITQKGYYVGKVIIGEDTITLGNRTRFDLAQSDVENYLT